MTAEQIGTAQEMARRCQESKLKNCDWSTPILATYVNRRIPSERRATMLSVQSVVASLILAGVEPATGALADTVGLRGMFIAVAAMTIVVGGGTLLLWDRAEREDQRNASGGATLLREPDLVPEGARERVAVS